MFIVMRNSGRTMTCIGTSESRNEARKIMKQDYERELKRVIPEEDEDICEIRSSGFDARIDYAFVERDINYDWKVIEIEKGENNERIN